MIGRTLALAGLVGVVACATAAAAPVTVDLRVEGATQTLYEGPVVTDGHQIDKGDGPHPCDGTNGDANATPGPTMTSALDDSELDWAGTWFSDFDDFGIDRIGPDASDASRFWGYALNYAPVNVGGCQQQVAGGDQVLFGYDFFSKTHLLKLNGPARAATGESFSVAVADGDGGEAIVGASVGGATTGAAGTAAVSINTPGVHRLKAERADSLRSNALDVCVYSPGSGGCGTVPAPGTQTAPDAPQLPQAPGSTPDTTAPRAFITGLRGRRTYRRAPRLLRGRIAEDRGIHQVYLRLRMIDRNGCRWLSGRREVFTRPRTCTRARYIRLGDAADWSYLLPFSLPRGARYIFDVKVLDRALNRDVEQVRFRVAR
ncbi:MAG: hypothetical protein WD844_16310 [Thermoleophilaceae bacterium]